MEWSQGGFDAAPGSMNQHKQGILAAIRRRHEPDTLLEIANTMHGHLGRVQFDLAEMAEEGTVTRHTLTSTDEYGTPFSYYTYSASSGRRKEPRWQPRTDGTFTVASG